MTQHRNDPDKISNYFDRLLSGIGHRGSSFMDIDAVTHDGATHRWLLQEFKHEGEPLDKAQHWMLKDLAGELPKHFTVWVVVKREDGLIEFADYRPGQRVSAVTITVEEYRARFRCWWQRGDFNAGVRTEQPKPVQPVECAERAPVARELVDTDIRW